MTKQNIMVVIPPEMSDRDECYSEVVEYVAACTGFSCMPDDPQERDSVSCGAFFEDNEGNIWYGQLHSTPYPDGSRKYTIDREKKPGRQ